MNQAELARQEAKRQELIKYRKELVEDGNADWDGDGTFHAIPPMIIIDQITEFYSY